ncbi:MAG: DNA repair protein RecN [Candidatus Binataceae bacterium]
MLTELRIRNFAVIEEAALSFGPGLNVLTGETGAGKTIIMTALGLLVGMRASPDMIRTGAREAVLEGVFELEGETPADGEWLDADGRELLIRRVIAEGGRSRVSINDRLATVQALARIGSTLVRVYGQHEQQTLLARENHLEILDRQAGLETQLSAYRACYDRVRELNATMEDLERHVRERADRLELARFRVNELERTRPLAGEDEQLLAERSMLANATRLVETAVATEQALYGAEGAAIDTIAQAEIRLADAAALDPRLKEPFEMITSARANLEEAAHALAAYANKIEADPARLEQVEARLQELTLIRRKYGGSLEAALEILENSRREIAELETVAESKAELQAQLENTLDQLLAHARVLSERRRHHAAELKRRTEAELKTLGMRNAAFEARFAELAPDDGVFARESVTLGPAGADSVEFYLAPNLGQPPMALAKVASGGELSRVMLALKCLEAQHRGVASLIFDEVDAGIGGAVGEIVGRKLHQLSRFHQVLCVTHLAQIAAFATSHFVVEKEERRGATRSLVTALDARARPSEIARMLGGVETSDKFVRAARELLERAGH